MAPLARAARLRMTATPRSRVSRALGLSAMQWRHLVIAVLELARARARLALTSSADCLARLRSHSSPAARPPEPGARDSLAGIAWALAAAAARVPWRADCLVQAMAADRWLRRRGLAPEFFLGVAKAEAGDLRAHAWVRCGDITVTGGADDGFSVLIEPGSDA